MFKICFITCVIFMLTQPDYASAQKYKTNSDQKTNASSIFIPLPETIVVNFVDKDVKHLRADIGLRVSNTQTAEAVQRHLPRIQNFLLDFLAQQDRETLNNPKKLKAIRELALERIINILYAESEPNAIEALFFMTFQME